jgi:alcohol dehydrogenase class IV
MMTAMFRSPVVVYGLDVSRKTGEYSVNFGKKTLIVTDNDLDKIGLLDGIKRSLTDARADGLKIPPLRGLGISPNKFDKVVEQISNDALVGGSAVFNPRKATPGEILGFIERHIDDFLGKSPSEF